jgi:TorA maturation chaperone TorD
LADAAADLNLAEEDRLRAQWYALLGAILARPPDQARLDALAGLAGDESDLGQGVTALAAAAAAANPKTAEQEFFDLFIGVGRGELVPYGSYYLAGFLYEKPLANVRSDMRRLGIARTDEVKEPEDHIGALMEMMSGLITGAFAQPADLASQRQFFEAHVGSWAPRFFEDLENTPAATFYKPVARIGRIFMGIEAQAFEMVA